MATENNIAAMALTMGVGDSVVLEGKDRTEVVFKEHYKGDRVRFVIIADKSVKIIRRTAADRKALGHGTT
jgi:hypothetical protein